MRAASSAWWLVPVLAKACCSWLRAVVTATPIDWAAAWRLALLRRPALHHQLPDLRRPGRRDHPLHLPSEPRVVLVSPAEADRGFDAQMHDSVTDGSVSRWSFHTARVDPTAPLNARCRKNVVVRSFVFF